LAFFFEKFLTEEDNKAAFLFRRLQFANKMKKNLKRDNDKTKDPILDLSSALFNLYGVKLAVYYHDRPYSDFTIKGIQNIDVLHECLIELVDTFFAFPCVFVQSLKIKNLTICEEI